MVAIISQNNFDANTFILRQKEIQCLIESILGELNHFTVSVAKLTVMAV